MRAILLLVPAALAVPLLLGAASAPLTEATFTRIINDVKVAKSASTPTPAKVNDLFKTPDVVRTAANSLAELTALDKTITRVGANTVFSFSDSGRTVNLQQGSLLFHSPKGKGGGTIKTGGAAAAVLGTTLIVSATPDGGFKVVVLEGRAQVTLPNGNFRQVNAGQLLFVLPGNNQFGPRLDVNLGTLVQGSRLVNGFPEPLPSMPEVQRAIDSQAVLINTGQAEDTQILVGSSATTTQVEVIDPNVVQSGVAASSSTVLPALNVDLLVQSANLSLFPNNLFLTAVNTPIGPFPADDYTGLLGRNITIDHPFVSLQDTTVNYFDIAANGVLTFNNVTGPNNGMITFVQPSGPTSFDLYLTAGQGLDFGNTFQLTYTGGLPGNVYFASGANTIIGSGFISMINTLGGIGIGAYGNLDTMDVGFNSQNVALNAKNNLFVSDLTFFTANGGGSSIRFFGDVVTVGGSSLMSLSADSFSAQGATSSESDYFAPFSPSLPPATTAGFLLVDFTSATLQARIDAQTIILDQVNFAAGSTAILRTTTGLSNFGTVLSGHANFINSTYGGSPINSGSFGSILADVNNPSGIAPIQVQQLP